MTKSIDLTAHLIRRELRNRYLGSISGGLWALLQPLLQLAIYGLVWTYVFNMRPPGGGSVGAIVPFLALGMWPWNAFSESITRATTAIQDNAGLIGKVALPRALLVLATVSAAFLLHGFGFCAIMLVLGALGFGLHLALLPIALLVFVPLFVLALGFSLLFASVQVFVRDLAQVLGQIMPLWMFASPVLYSREQLPAAFRGWLAANPFSFYPECLRALLFDGPKISAVLVTVAIIVALAVGALGYAVFRRLDPRFEDFL